MARNAVAQIVHGKSRKVLEIVEASYVAALDAGFGGISAAQALSYDYRSVAVELIDGSRSGADWAERVSPMTYIQLISPTLNLWDGISLPYF
jgi:hypothetical protein